MPASRRSKYRAAIRSACLAAGFLIALPGCAEQRGQTIQRISVRAHGVVGVACSLPGVELDCNLNADAKLPMLSVYKFPIAMAVLHAVEEGRITLTQPIQFLSTDALRPGQRSPLRDQHPQGGVGVPVQELLRLTVSESDGTASDLLLRALGGPPAVDRYIRSLGIEGIAVLDTEKTIGSDVRALYRNTSTPDAMVHLLRMVADNSPLTADHTALLLRLMSQGGTSAARIKGQLPPDTEVAHKTGTSDTDHGLTHATNDVGLITMRDGRKLAIAVMIEDSPASERTRERVIAQIARAIWSEANNKLGASEIK